MTDIYAFGENWAIPAPLRTKLDTVVADWVAANPQSDPSLNVADHGAKGDGTTDDTAAIQAALNAAPVGSTVLFPPGVYVVTSELVVDKTLHLSGYGATLDARGVPAGTAYGQVVALRLTGKLGAPVAVSSPVTKWSRAITGIADTAGLASGDLVLIANEEQPVPGMTRVDRDKGELAVVQSVDSSTQVTLSTGALFDYGVTGLRLHKVNPIQGATVRGLSIRMGGTGSWHNGLTVQYGRNITVAGVTVDGAEDVAISLNTVYGGTVAGCYVSNSWSPAATGGTGYGVAVVEGSRHVTVQANQFYACRHFVAGGGKWPAVFVDVVGNHGERSRNAAYDCHEPCFYWKFVRNTAVGVDSGFVIRGQYITVEANEVEDSVSFAYRVQTFDGVTEQRGIRLIRNTSARSGFGLSVEGRAVASEPNSVKINLEVSGNTIESVAGSNAAGIFVGNFQGAAVKGNSVKGTTGPGVYILGISGSPSTDLDATDNKVSNTGTQGALVQYVSGGSADGFNITTTGYSGVEVTNCDDLTITGITSVAASRYGLLVNASNRVHVSNLQIRGVVSASYDAVRVTGSSDISFVGGVISSPRWAVYSTTTDYVLLTNVNMRGAAQAARFSIDATNKVVTNNL